MKENQTLERVFKNKTLTNGNAAFGKHLQTAISCNENLLSILKMPVVMDNMTTAGEPIVARFGEGIEVGLPGVKIITTSAIRSLQKMLHKAKDLISSITYFLKKSSTKRPLIFLFQQNCLLRSN